MTAAEVLRALEDLGVLGDILREKLEGDKAAEFGVFGLVDNAHAAATESLHDAIVGDRLARKGGRVRHVLREF